MLFINSITNLFFNQQFKCESYEYDDELEKRMTKSFTTATYSWCRQYQYHASMRSVKYR